MEIAEFVEKAKVKYGEILPVVAVSESLIEFDEAEDDFCTRYSGEYLIDLNKFTEEADITGRFRYVQFILEAVVLDGMTRTTASLKYSFTDTPDWWTEFHADTTEGRTVLPIDVELNF